VATLHVREVPGSVYEGLRAHARREGLSINALVIRILEERAEHDRRQSQLAQRLEEISSRIVLPPDAAKPEDLIREGRAEQDERVRSWT
jgi:hypothetical protein